MRLIFGGGGEQKRGILRHLAKPSRIGSNRR
jgi:hypothetical protein